MRNVLTGALLAMALAACSEQPAEQAADPPQTASSTYQSEIAPLLRTRCATCHLTGQEAGKLQLTPDQAIAAVVNVKAEGAPGLMRVAPGKPDESYLVMKLEGTHLERGGAGATMPFGAPPLAQADILIIRNWIEQGAKP